MAGKGNLDRISPMFLSLIAALKAFRAALGFGYLTLVLAVLNLPLKALRDSSYPCLTVKRLPILFLYLELEVNWTRNISVIWSHEVIDIGVNACYQLALTPWKVVGKALHLAASMALQRFMFVKK